MNQGRVPFYSQLSVSVQIPDTFKIRHCYISLYFWAIGSVDRW